MHLVGKVFGPGPSGELIVRVDRPWRWGEGLKLVDRRGRALGRVENIIGPAAAPYLVVRPADPRDAAGAGRIKGADVYIEDMPETEGKTPEFRQRTKGRPTGPPSKRNR